MPFDFIFMLTRDDRTVADAATIVATALAAGVRHIGFKDVGLPVPELRALAEAMRADGREVMLEVVSEDRDEELRSVEAALEIGVDWLLGMIPIVGAVPDFFFRSNSRNLRMIRRHLDRHHPETMTVEGKAREI